MAKKMEEQLKNLMDALAKSAGYKYATKEAAHNAGCCIVCGEKIEGRLRSEIEKKEYVVSGICGICWDDMFT